MKKRIVRIGLWVCGVFAGLMLLLTLLIYVFKDEICRYAIDEANAYLKAKVSISEVDLTFWGSFPNLSVDFNHVFIPDSYTYATNKDTLLYSDRIRLKFNPLDIWRENYTVHSIEVSSGTVQLKVNRYGKVNYDILKPSSDSTNEAFELDLESVAFEDIRFSYRNTPTAQKYRSRIHKMNLDGRFSDDRFEVHTSANLLLKQLKSGDVSLLKDQPAEINLRVYVNTLSDVINIPKASISIASLPFEIKGTFRKDSTIFELHSKDIPLTDFASKFALSGTEEVRKFDGSGLAFADLFVRSDNKANEAAEVTCNFGIQEGSLTEPERGIRIQKINLSGTYSNVGGQENEFLKLEKLKLLTPGGPFDGKLEITRFEKPKYNGFAHGVIDVAMFHSLFQIPMVEQAQGMVDLSTDFEVSTEFTEAGEKEYSVKKCDGSIELRNMLVKLQNDHRTFRELNGALYLRGEEAGIDDVSLKVGSTDLRLNGIFRNLVNYISDQGVLEADVEISGNKIDLQDLGTTTKEEKIQDGRSYVIPADIRGHMRTDIGELIYEKHTFRDVNGNMEMSGRQLYFPNVTLRNAEATINGSLIIAENAPEIFDITAEVASKNLQFKPLFKEWENFHQSVLGAENIFGKAEAKVFFKAPFDLRSGIIYKSIKAQVYLKVTEGRLANVKSFKSITESLQTNSAKLVLGKENIASLEKKLMDLRFETLENTLTIENGKVTIPEMMILSSALDMETSGTHTFDNVIDYRFSFQFRDLKNKSRTTEFGEEIDDGTGMKVFMRMYGNVENPTIIWDKQSRKEQVKENLTEEKETVKSMLKSEFGLFGKDSTVRNYQEKERPKETIKVELDPAEEARPEDKKPKKDSKLRNTLKNWKQEADKDKQEKIEFN
ncbi:MAG: AsmA-like C-terminal region-containing protein [Cryomorphaceae bacterium]|jgi:hypothetical protein|nr:AsmA-like C-terminal region-containing protein [Cryomorphaceae bacterium]